jgi:hypothetical protein
MLTSFHALYPLVNTTRVSTGLVRTLQMVNKLMIKPGEMSKDTLLIPRLRVE